MNRARILSVGQCGFDHGSISRRLGRDFDAAVEGADTHEEALARLRSDAGYDLVLINRVGDSDGRPGVELVRALKAEPALAGVPVMLVSDHASAQDEAVAAGALRGFGKSDLRGPAALRPVEEALGSAR